MKKICSVALVSLLVTLSPEVHAKRIADSTCFLPALTHLFTTRMLLGQFDPKGSTPWDDLGEKDIATLEHRRLALVLVE